MEFDRWGTQIRTLSNHTNIVTCLAFNSDNLLASGPLDGRINLWNITKLEKC